MKINLKKYYQNREILRENAIMQKGPVITLSRQYGCEANRISRMLISKINELPEIISRGKQWRFVNKEILEESSKDLGLKTEVIDRVIQEHESGAIQDIFKSLSLHYSVSDKNVLQKVKEIIETYAGHGNVIIIGRGASAITQNVTNALHIRLYAPIKWRAKAIAANRGVSEEDAIKVCNHFDHNRTKWLEHLSGQKYNDGMFDLMINVESLTDKEIVNLIFWTMTERGMIPKMKLHQGELEAA